MLRPASPHALLLLAVAACAAPESAPAPTDAETPPSSAGARAEAPIPSASTAAPDVALPSVLVYKTETCGCCDLWVDHLTEAGFSVDARNVRDLMAVKRDVGVPVAASSCHTAIVDGVVVEGHVPAEQIRRFLAERPAGAIGLAVPGMPIGSPGMEGPGARPYDVLTLDREGRTAIWATVDPR